MKVTKGLIVTTVTANTRMGSRVKSFLPAVGALGLLSLFAMPVLGQDAQLQAISRQLFERTIKLIEAEKIDISEAAHILVVHGDEKSADEYYKRIGTKLSFAIEKSNLDTLLEYLGYNGIRGIYIELLESSVLMPKDQNSY